MFSPVSESTQAGVLAFRPNRTRLDCLKLPKIRERAHMVMFFRVTVETKNLQVERTVIRLVSINVMRVQKSPESLC
jgi:hypothetical protein